MMTLQNIVQIYCKDVFQRSTYLCQHLSGGMYKQCLTTLTYKLLMLSIAFKKIHRSCWSNNVYIRGGYSHTTVARDKTGCGRKDLTIPVYCEIDDSVKVEV